jgi:hypothetical protein
VPDPVRGPIVLMAFEGYGLRGMGLGEICDPAAHPQRRARRDGRLYVLRGRVRCALCGRRMGGTYQRHAN